jgi:hypothetical protein
MNFDEWYEINPFKDKLDSMCLSLTEKKRMTPIVVTSSFLVEIRNYYMEFVQKKKRYVVPAFVRSEFPLFYKNRHFSVLNFYEVEKDLEYLIKHIPVASCIFSKITIRDVVPEILNTKMKIYNLSYEASISEVIRVPYKGKVIGYKFAVDKPK